MRNYIPGYLESVASDGYGWPTGLDEDTQRWLVGEVRDLLSARPYGISDLRSTILWRAKQQGVSNAWTQASVYDWAFACLHRACLAASAEQVWSL